MDWLAPIIRSHIMRSITSKNTRPEILVRKYLFGIGFRFRLHQQDLPGKPDLILPKYKAAIFIHGCFWHGHGCKFGRLPSSNKDYWLPKIRRTKYRDQQHIKNLLFNDWRVAVIWECSICRCTQKRLHLSMNRIQRWIKSSRKLIEVSSSSANQS